jgi:hypothetical protein
MLADPVHDRRVCTARVVQVRKAVRKAGAEVEQRRRRPPGHARPPVGRACAHAFEQAEHDTQLRDLVHSGDNRHLGGAGVREARLHARADGGLDETECSCSHPALPAATGALTPPAEHGAQPTARAWMNCDR